MSEWKKSRIKYNLKIKNGREITKDVENSKDSIPVYGSGGYLSIPMSFYIMVMQFYLAGKEVSANLYLCLESFGQLTQCFM